MMKEEGFESAYAKVNGKEPDVTFRGPGLIDSPYADPDPDATFDYIFFKGAGLEPITAETRAKEHKPGDPGIYASDHLAVVSDFDIHDMK